MRLLGHPGSDSDETWWKLFPGVSRSFLNSSGTKITVKNHKKMKFKIYKKLIKLVKTLYKVLKTIFCVLFFKFADSRHAQLSTYAVFL